jgi:hypothetical protein
MSFMILAYSYSNTREDVVSRLTIRLWAAKHLLARAEDIGIARQVVRQVQSVPAPSGGYVIEDMAVYHSTYTTNDAKRAYSLRQDVAMAASTPLPP